jgi:hypothetical protein
MAGFITRARRRARHRAGCFRWYGDGCCVDCGCYTGTARDAVAGLVHGDVVFCKPASAPKQRILRRLILDGDVVFCNQAFDGVTPLTDLGTEPLPAVKTDADDPARRSDQQLTADQLATQLAWQLWRLRQGDPEPHIPRRKQGGANRR